MLGAASGAVAGLVAITPACGFVGPMGALDHRPGFRRRLPLGCDRIEAHARRRRCAGRVRRARCGRYRGCAADRRVRQPRAGRLGHLRLRRQQAASPDYSIGTQVWAQLQGVVTTWSGRPWWRSLPTRSSTWWSGLRVPEEEEREGLDIVRTANRPTTADPLAAARSRAAGLHRPAGRRDRTAGAIPPFLLSACRPFAVAGPLVALVCRGSRPFRYNRPARPGSGAPSAGGRRREGPGRSATDPAPLGGTSQSGSSDRGCSARTRRRWFRISSLR